MGDQKNILIRHDLKFCNPSSWLTPGQCDLYIFAMASDLSVDPPEDHDQRPSTILFEIIATANTDIIFKFLQTEVENAKWQGKTFHMADLLSGRSFVFYTSVKESKI